MLIAIGTGIYSPTLNLVAITTVDPTYAGLASGVYHTARQTGMAMGIACTVAIVVLALRYIRA